MTQSPTNPSSTNAVPRCTHRYPNGRRCRIAAGPNPDFCALHARLPQNLPDPAQIASILTANLDDFTSALQVNDFLSRLLLLLAQDKISTRRAAVLAYITNQIIRTLAVIAKEENDPDNTQMINCKGDYCRDHDVNFKRKTIIMDMCRPEFSDGANPQDTPATQVSAEIKPK